MEMPTTMGSLLAMGIFDKINNNTGGYVCFFDVGTERFILEMQANEGIIVDSDTLLLRPALTKAGFTLSQRRFKGSNPGYF